MIHNSKIELLVIVGPTASGKSDLSVRLAEEFNGEVVSADSRQVYKGLDIGTGKITREEMAGIAHHCLDIAEPKDRFTVVQWKKHAEDAVADIHSRSKLPIVCGGTGYYISALVDDIRFPEINGDPAERKRLEERSSDELFDELRTLDPRRGGAIDPRNKRRLSRAIMIARELGAVPQIRAAQPERYDSLFIGVSLSNHELKERIRIRLIRRIEAGMIEEAKRLHDAGLSFERMDELGLEYRYLAQLLKGEINKEQLIEILSAKIWQYSRRQMTWWRKDQRLHWFAPTDFKAICTEINNFSINKK